MIWILAGIALCVLAEGFFSGSETAFYTVNRLRLRSRVEAGWPGAVTLQRLLDRANITIMTTLIGTNTMVYAASALATELLRERRHAGLLATLIMAPIAFLFGEMIPKDIYRRRADTLMYRLARPIDICRILVSPILLVLRGLVAIVTHPVPAEQRGTALSRAALREWIAEGTREGVLSGYQQALAGNVMDLLQKKVSSVMIPLSKTVTVPATLSGSELRQALLPPGHSRLPVVDPQSKTIIGILHVLDYICAQSPNPSARALAHEAVHVKHSDGVTAVLVALQRRRQHVAIVDDDRAKPVGIVTVKDLVEEIVGELREF